MAINVPLNAQLQNATQLQQQIQNAVNSVQLNLGGAGGSRALNSLSQPLGRLTGQADEFTKSLDAANARVLAFGASVGVLNAITNAFKAMVNTTIMVEKTLADINVVFNKSSSEIKNFGKGIFDVAKQTGQSFEEVSKAALEFSRQGLTIEDTLARTKDALVLTRLTGLDTAKAVQGLTATINSFSKEALTSSEIVNKLASVDQKFSVSAADLTEALSRSASVAQNAGVNFDELIGIITSLQERTARGGAVIGNSIKTIFTRIQRADVLADLDRLGVAIEDVNTKKLLSASEILKNLAGNIGALGQIQKSGIFEEVAGGFQINQLQALLTDLAGAQSTASKAQQVATGATNEAYVANERLNQTISSLINNSVEGLKELGATLGDLGIADSIKTALGVVNGFIESVQNLMEGDGPGAKFAQGIVKGIGSVLSGPGLALFWVIISKLVIDLGRFATQGLKTFLGIGKAASEQKALQEAIVTTLSRNAALQSQIGKFQGNAVAQAAILAGIYNQQEASLKRQAATAQGMASVLFSQGMRAGPQGFTQTKRAAGGYLPSAEAADVSRGVGGASSSSQVVSIPNFAFGNGKRGTMIANTSEYIVPNYANGGSAIFNQDMVSSMGLPAGAQKIRAAGGYIPNFAKPLVIDAQKDLGGIGMITVGGDPNEKGNAAYRFSYQRAGITANKINNLKNSSYAKDASPIHVVNMVGSKGLTALGGGSSEDKRSAFSSKLNSKLIPSIVDLSRDLFKDYFEVPNLSPITSKPILSPSVEGIIFQEIVAIAADAFRKDGQSTAFQGEDNRPFDYNPQEPADPRLQKLFFDDFDVSKADAKRSDNSESRESMVKKIFNDSYIFKKLLNSRPDIQNELGESFTLNAGSKRAQTTTKSNFLEQNASKGYIPNFANKALADSINRERIESGLPMSAISVTQDSRLMNARNPAGLAVINSRDEPNGKIPNFANTSGGAGDPEKVAKGFGDAAGKIFLLQTAVSFATGAFNDLDSATGKIVNKFAEASANITSLTIAGGELSSADLPGKLGKAVKALGFLGIGAGIAYEGFKLADFAIKEFSGENDKAATALSKLQTAAQSAAISLQDLTPEGQRSAQETGKKALEDFSGNFISNFFSEASGKNPEIQKQAGLLSAQGLGGDQLKSLIEDIALEIAAESQGPSYKADGSQTAVDKYNKMMEQLSLMGEGGTNLPQLQDIVKNTPSILSEALTKAFNSPMAIKSGQGLASIREKVQKGIISPNEDPEKVAKEQFGKDVDQAKIDRTREILRLQQQVKTSKEATIKVERDFALKEQISLDLAKQKLDNVLERKNLEIESVGPIERQLKLELETLDLTKAAGIEKQRQLELIKLQKTEQQGIVKAIGSTIDELSKLPSDALISGVSVENYKKITDSLEGKKFENIEQAKVTVNAIAESLGIEGVQLERINQKFAESFDINKKLLDIQKGQVNTASDLEIAADKTKQKYESQLYAITRIAALAKATADINISGLGIEKATIGSQISALESSNANPYLGVLDKQANERSILELRLQQLEVDRKINAENQNAQNININTQIAEKNKELSNIPKVKLGEKGYDEYETKVEKITDKINELVNSQSQATNQLSTQNIELNDQIALIEKQIALIGKRGTFKEGLSSGLQELENSTLDFQNTLGKEIPQLFSSNLAQGLNDAISGAKSLKEALTDAATSFLNAITQKNIENLANMFTVGVGGIGKANGGMISGGSGTKDDVPAMLMGGEYVVKKSAVKKYGSNFLDSLNQGKLSGYATGGAVQSGKGGFYAPGEYGQGAITGQRQLLDFATQDFTSGQFDQMGSYGMTGASINLEAESGRLTMAGRENSPIFERTQQAKEEAFQVYLQSLQVDKQYQEQLKQIEEADKARKKQLTTAIVSAVASTALSAAGGAAKTGVKNAQSLQAEPLTIGQKFGAMWSGGNGAGGVKNLLSGNFSSAFNDLSSGVQQPKTYSSGISNTWSNIKGSLGFGKMNYSNREATYGNYDFNPSVGLYGYRGRASGGMISGGSGIRDDVPAMLTGGEFVLNNRATKKIGMSNLQRLNSGDTSSQQDPEKGSSDLMQALISKLDELISATSKSGGDNVVVNVNSNEAQGERNNGQQSANEKDLHKKIKAAVLEVITQEKRLGGSLNK